jgi:hypothetical protein
VYLPALPILLYLSAAGFIYCTVGVKNTGTVRLKQVQLQGPENNCTVIPVLAPGQSAFTCTVRRTVTQTEFDNREADGTSATELSVTVASIATPNVSDPLVNPTATTVFSGLQLVVRRDLSAKASLGRTSVNKTGDVVEYTVVVNNTGNVKLRSVNVVTTLRRADTVVTAPALSAYTCTGGSSPSLPADLSVAGVLTCTATYTFSAVTDIEAGDLNFTTQVQATEFTPVPAAPETLSLRVINAPMVALALNASTCDAPAAAGRVPGHQQLYASAAFIEQQLHVGCGLCGPAMGTVCFSTVLIEQVTFCCAACRPCASQHHDLHRRPACQKPRQCAHQLHWGVLSHWRNR